MTCRCRQSLGACKLPEVGTYICGGSSNCEAVTLQSATMRFYNQIAILVAALIFGISPSLAQQPQNTQANPLDNVPDKMPFNIPYGAPITAARAQDVIQAAEQEANRRGWPMNIAVVDSGGNLVSFLRMDGAQLASIAISEHKARASVKFRRATRVYEDACRNRTTNIF